jgi:hypothetical protein
MVRLLGPGKEFSEAREQGFRRAMLWQQVCFSFDSRALETGLTNVGDDAITPLKITDVSDE